MSKNTNEKTSFFESIKERKSALTIALLIVLISALFIYIAAGHAYSDLQTYMFDAVSAEKAVIEKNLTEKEILLGNALDAKEENLKEIERLGDIVAENGSSIQNLIDRDVASSVLINSQQETIAYQQSLIEKQNETIENQKETIDKTDDAISEIADIIGANIDPISSESMYEGLENIEETQQVIVENFNTSANYNEYLKMLDDKKAEINDMLKYYPDINPAAGKISYTFGNHYDTKDGKTQVKFHRGLDIRNSSGGPIYATAAGTVTEVHLVDDGTGLGYYVRIDHGNGYMTLYGHLASSKVTVGQKVEKGQVIAMMGRTGAATGTHVHYEVYLHGVLQDPIDFVNY